MCLRTNSSWDPIAPLGFKGKRWFAAWKKLSIEGPSQPWWPGCWRAQISPLHSSPALQVSARGSLSLKPPGCQAKSLSMSSWRSAAWGINQGGERQDLNLTGTNRRHLADRLTGLMACTSSLVLPVCAVNSKQSKRKDASLSFRTLETRLVEGGRKKEKEWKREEREREEKKN